MSQAIRVEHLKFRGRLMEAFEKAWEEDSEVRVELHQVVYEGNEASAAEQRSDAYFWDNYVDGVIEEMEDAHFMLQDEEDEIDIRYLLHIAYGIRFSDYVEESGEEFWKRIRGERK